MSHSSEIKWNDVSVPVSFRVYPKKHIKHHVTIFNQLNPDAYVPLELFVTDGCLKLQRLGGVVSHLDKVLKGKKQNE